jgi:hypothetical protein
VFLIMTITGYALERSARKKRVTQQTVFKYSEGVTQLLTQQYAKSQPAMPGLAGHAWKAVRK